MAWDGKKLGKYVIKRPLGQGGMGTVYVAVQQGLEREVALKVMPEREGAEGAVGMRRFMREASICAKLSHPNIVKVFDFGYEDETYYYAMELLPARCLDHVIKEEGRLPPRRAVEIARDLLSGLACFHPLGIVHRDIKPSNILLDPEGRAVLTDFGLVKDLEATNLTRLDQVIGTPQYIAPEMIGGRGLTQLTDLYQVGVVLYRMLSGRVPFPGETAHALFFNIQEGRSEPLAQASPDTPPELCEVVTKLISLHPADRYPTAGEAAAALEQFAMDQSVADLAPLKKRSRPAKPVAPPAPVAPPNPARRKAGVPVAAVVAFAVLAGVATGLALTIARRPPPSEVPAPPAPAVAPPTRTPASPVPGDPAEELFHTITVFDPLRRMAALEEQLRLIAPKDQPRVLADSAAQPAVDRLARALGAAPSADRLLPVDLPWEKRVTRVHLLFELLCYDLFNVSWTGKSLLGIRKFLEPAMAFDHIRVAEDEKSFKLELVPPAIHRKFGAERPALLLDNFGGQDSYNMENNRESYIPDKLRSIWDIPSNAHVLSSILPFEVESRPGRGFTILAFVQELDYRSTFLLRVKPAAGGAELAIPLPVLVPAPEANNCYESSTRLGPGVLPPGKYTGHVSARRIMSRFFNKPSLLQLYAGASRP